jgi:hypothetical protein
VLVKPFQTSTSDMSNKADNCFGLFQKIIHMLHTHASVFFLYFTLFVLTYSHIVQILYFASVSKPKDSFSGRCFLMCCFSMILSYIELCSSPVMFCRHLILQWDIPS